MKLKQLATFDGFSGPLKRLAFSPDEKTLIACSAASMTHWAREWQLWDIPKCARIETAKIKINADAEFLSCWYDGTNPKLVVRNANIVTDVDLLSGKIRSIYTSPDLSVDMAIAASAAITRDSRLYAIGDVLSNVHLFEVSGGDRKAVLSRGPMGGMGGPVLFVEFSPDCNYLVTFGGMAHFSADLWDLRSGKLMHRLKRPQDGGWLKRMFNPQWHSTAAFSDDSKKVALGHASEGFSVWDVELGAMLMEKRPTKIAESILIDAVSFDSTSQEVVICEGSSVNIYPISDRAETHTAYEAHSKAITCCVFSASRRLFATGASDNKIVIWETDQASS